MKFLSPVVWSEGMHLAQHHFQLQSRYFEDLTGFTVGSLFFRGWGLAGIELDAEALLNGTVSFTHARGIMPDGLVFNFPEDPPPEPLEIASLFSPVQDSHIVYLTIPPLRLGAPNCAVDGATAEEPLRYTLTTRAIPDELTGADEKKIGLARKNFTLELDTGETDDRVRLPVAKVRRDGRGHFVYDPEYIAPCVRIGASDALLQLGTRLVEMLDARSDAMLRERQATSRPLAEWASREVANFWLTHTVNAAASSIRHMLRSRSTHPEQFYTELARLAGALCTFSMEAHPRDLPSYDHDDLATTFAELDRRIRRHLEIIIPTDSVVIPLSVVAPSFHTATVGDDRCFSNKAQWYLGVRSTSPRADVVAGVPKLVKVCSAEHIMRLVKEGLPGLTLEHEPAPPSALSPRIGSHYFRLITKGPCWTLMAKTHNAGVYVPGAIAEAELELTIVPGK